MGYPAAGVCFSIGSQLPPLDCQCLLFVWVSPQVSLGNEHVQDSEMWVDMLLCSQNLGDIPIPSHSQTLSEASMSSFP